MFCSECCERECARKIRSTDKVTVWARQLARLRIWISLFEVPWNVSTWRYDVSVFRNWSFCNLFGLQHSYTKDIVESALLWVALMRPLLQHPAFTLRSLLVSLAFASVTRSLVAGPRVGQKANRLLGGWVDRELHPIDLVNSDSALCS